MSPVPKPILMLWYVSWSAAFIFGVMLSFAVLIGIVSDSTYAPYAGVFGLIVFWNAASKYRAKIVALSEESNPDLHKDWDDDEDDQAGK
jgi:hypothetical protein